MGQDRRAIIERLFRRYAKGISSYLLTRVGDPDTAEAITARVFLTVVRRFDQCHSSPVGWLWAVVRSELAQEFRGRRDVVPLGDDLVAPDDGPAEQVERREMQKRMRAAVAELNEDEQQVITMKFFLHMRNNEIAEATGQTAGNIGVRVHRALRRLRAIMEPSPADERFDVPGRR